MFTEIHLNVEPKKTHWDKSLHNCAEIQVRRSTSDVPGMLHILPAYSRIPEAQGNHSAFKIPM